MIFFTESAAAICSGMPELCPSPCPGAPSMIGSCQATPGFWDACGMSSMSDPSAITGFPVPHVAMNAVGMPARPRSILKPFLSRISLRYFDVSNSWNPGSAKLKTVSFMRWMSSRIPSTSSDTSALYLSNVGFGAAFAAGVLDGCSDDGCGLWGAAVNVAVTVTTAATIQNREECIRFPPLESDLRSCRRDARRSDVELAQERDGGIVDRTTRWTVRGTPNARSKKSRTRRPTDGDAVKSDCADSNSGVVSVQFHTFPQVRRFLEHEGGA